MDKIDKKRMNVFYASDQWRNLRNDLISQRGARCEVCGRLITNSTDIVIHHKKEITPSTVNDVTISLNPDNLEVVCRQCHDSVCHKRFGRDKSNKKKVYIIYGAPCSGKTTTLNSMLKYGDLVIDYDNIYEALSGQPRYIKPENLMPNVAAVFNSLIDAVRTRAGRWHNAYIVGGFAEKGKREDYAVTLGAELILCNTPRDECIRRLIDSDRDYNEWIEYINQWFTDYVP